MKTLNVALIGNPNSGKTTLFNALTGSHQKVGNWPGVTVEKKSGEFLLEDRAVHLVDLPGIYSLDQDDCLGLDEKIARDFLDHNGIDLVINIVDAANLERNLVLTQQLLERHLNVVVALNMLDVARQQGLEIDHEALGNRLEADVVPIVASRGTGVDNLKAVISDAATSTKRQYDRSETSTGDAGERLLVRHRRARALVDGIVRRAGGGETLTERIDRWVLNRWLGVPFFLFMMYVMFTFAVNVGAVFIDFFDILFGAVLVDGVRWLLSLVSAPEWIKVLLADGLGGGIQLVTTFIPVVGFLFLCLSVLEDSGYMSRAAFVVDRLMAKIGLPGNAFVPLIVGFGCNVPAVMASRTLSRDSDRLLTIAMAPFMSCGARLTVYALFAAAFFPVGGQNIVFALYLLGIVMAVGTGWVFRRQIFNRQMAASFQEMPAYHLPVARNIVLTTWLRLKSFIFRAGKTIVTVVVALSFLNSIGLDGSFGHQDTSDSALSVIGKKITPAFAPIGLEQDNWAATVGLFTGLFAKEAIVGTLDAMYSEHEIHGADTAPDILAATAGAFGSIAANAGDLAGKLADPLGISIGNVSNKSAVAAEQNVKASTLTNMAAGFGGQFAAFCYLVFILLYAPCVATLGAVAKEAGWQWTLLVFSWCTGLGYLTASGIHQIGTFVDHPSFSLWWLAGCTVVLLVAIRSLKLIGRTPDDKDPGLIQVVQVG